MRIEEGGGLSVCGGRGSLISWRLKLSSCIYIKGQGPPEHPSLSPRTKHRKKLLMIVCDADGR